MLSNRLRIFATALLGAASAAPGSAAYRLDASGTFVAGPGAANGPEAIVGAFNVNTASGASDRWRLSMIFDTPYPNSIWLEAPMRSMSFSINDREISAFSGSASNLEPFQGALRFRTERNEDLFALDIRRSIDIDPTLPGAETIAFSVVSTLLGSNTFIGSVFPTGDLSGLPLEPDTPLLYVGNQVSGSGLTWRGRMPDTEYSFTLSETATVPAVPEAGTWAMMILGFGSLGAVERWRRREKRATYSVA